MQHRGLDAHREVDYAVGLLVVVADTDPELEALADGDALVLAQPDEDAVGLGSRALWMTRIAVLYTSVW